MAAAKKDRIRKGAALKATSSALDAVLGATKPKPKVRRVAAKDASLAELKKAVGSGSRKSQKTAAKELLRRTDPAKARRNDKAVAELKRRKKNPVAEVLAMNSRKRQGT